jgi:hypothetical protein
VDETSLNTSNNKTTTDLIMKMNDDALYGGHGFYDIDAADTLINRRGAIKQSSEKPMYASPPDLGCSPDEFDNSEIAEDGLSEEVSVVDTAPHLSPFSR